MAEDTKDQEEENTDSEATESTESEDSNSTDEETETTGEESEEEVESEEAPEAGEVPPDEALVDKDPEEDALVEKGEELPAKTDLAADVEPPEGETAGEETAGDEEEEEAEDEEEEVEKPPHHMGKTEPVESDYQEIKSDDPIPADQRPSAEEVLPEPPLGEGVHGVAAFFDHPTHLLYAAEQTRDSDFSVFDAFSPFPVHGMDEAMGLPRSWIPWVTFSAGLAGFLTACGLQIGIMGFDWPMIFGGKPFIAWPSFVPIMFELTVLLAGVITGAVMLKAAGCFKKPFIIDPEITNDRFVLWISADDEEFDREGVINFMKDLNPVEIRTIKKDQ